MEELNRYEFDVEIEGLEDVEDLKMPDDDFQANRFVKLIKENNAEKQRFKEQADNEHERIDALLNEKIEKIDNQNKFYLFALKQYFETVEHQKTKTQEKYTLLEGDLVLKKGGIDYKRDDKKLIEYLKANNATEYIKTVEKLAWSDLKKDIEVVNGEAVLKTTGEILNDIKVEEKDDTFTVK